MKKIWKFALMATTVCSLSLAATSCKDDDNDNGGGEPTAEEIAVEHAETFWSVAANLVSPFDVTDDYKNKTFEPTIGEAQEGSSTVRVVVVPDAEAAAAHFAAIVDADVKAGTASYTYQNDAVGTLVYTKSTDGKSLAKVDVSITQIPHLQQIVYKTVEQMGTNAVTDGVPYYSFGDVISRTRADGVKEYWMCIQAPFTKQGETSAVWGTVSQLPKENIWSYTASNGYTYQVPTHLGNNKEYMKDLAEMLYAIGAPEKWEQNLTDGPTNMKAFNLVTKQNVKYINQYYWMRVQRAWESLKLAETIFGVEEMSLLKSALTDDAQGLKLLYYGYSWHTLWSNELTLYESTITKGEGSEANIRHLTWKEVTKNVIKPNKIEVNCVTQLRNGSQWVNRDFFPEASEDELQPRFCFRFATTKELAGTGAFESMDNIKGIKDVYVYTKEYNVTVGSKQKMQEVAENDIIDDQDDEPNPIRVEEPAVGKVIGADGKFYATKDEADQHGGAVAMVAWLGGDMRCEYDSIYNGLAIAVNVSPGVAWMQDGNPQECEEYDLDMLDSKPGGRTGMAITTSMQIGCEANHVHPVATMAKEQQGIPFMSNKVRKARGFSPWFLGTYAQYVMALESLGASYKTSGTDTAWGFCESWNDAEFMGYFKNAGLDKLYDDLVTRDLWTATMVGEDGQTANMVWTLQMRNGDKNDWGKYAKFTGSVRALFLMGFKYGNGGTSNTFK